jgi:hypothetical protein
LKAIEDTCRVALCVAAVLKLKVHLKVSPPARESAWCLSI